MVRWFEMVLLAVAVAGCGRSGSSGPETGAGKPPMSGEQAAALITKVVEALQNDIPGHPLCREYAKTLSGGKGTDAELDIAGVKVKCLAYDSAPDGGSVGRAQVWLLASKPTVLVRHESDENWWAVTGLQVPRKIAGRDVICVEIKHRMAIPGGYVVRTEYVDAESPRRCGERREEFYDAADRLTHSASRTWPAAPGNP